MSTTMPTSRPVNGRFPVVVAAGAVAPASLLGAAFSLGVGAEGDSPDARGVLVAGATRPLPPGGTLFITPDSS